MDSRLWSAKVMVAVGFLMLLLTSLQGWGMVGILGLIVLSLFRLEEETR
jgi:hypothetical protein